jgi:hypothetical protein
MAKLVGNLVWPDDSDSGSHNNRDDLSWSGYRVLLYYTADIFDEDKLVEKDAVVYRDGQYRFTLNGNEREDNDARIAVMAPSGETVASHRLSVLLIDDESLHPITVKRTKQDFQITPIAEAAALQVRVSGQLFAVQKGETSVAARPVNILIRETPDASWTPIFSTETDRNGYFSGVATMKPITEAVAMIGEKAQPQRIILTEEKWLPQPLLLFSTGTGEASDADCSCDVTPPTNPESAELAENGASFSVDLGTSCQTFTMPNRTLEEFDFYRIARISDPAIKGITLPDTVREQLDLPEVNKLAFDSNTIAQVTKVSNYVATASYAERASIANDIERTTRSSVPDPEAMRIVTNLSSVSPLVHVTTNTVSSEEVLREHVNLAPLVGSGVQTAATWRLATDDKVAEAALTEATARIPASALRAALEDPDGFTPERIMTLERRASAEALAQYLNWRAKPVSGRGALTQNNPVDWDYTPEFYQATTIAHGHLLHYKQEWKADGYSLGELLNSVPLAPGQKKQIAVLDWDRRDSTRRDESTVSTEELTAELSHDRDINEIANANFRESLNGGSSASVGAVGGGLGLAIGPLVIGGGGGSSWASSNAWSDNSRSFSGQTMNDLRDQTSQASTAVRNQRSTVVETVYQQERVGATTEVIANHNRCHALTIQYFEVLRHFSVQERLAGVRECLFVPLAMTLFDDAKVLRWHDILRRACRRRDARRGFESIRRLNSPDDVPPDRRFADDPIEELSGKLRLRVAIARPKDPDEASRAVLEQTAWGFFGLILRVNPESIYEQYQRNSAKRDQIFRNEIAPGVARGFLESLEVVLIDREGHEHSAGVDLTVLSEYQENGIMEVALNDTASSPRLSRAEIVGIEIRTAYELPEFSKIILESARFNYRTERMRHRLYNNRRVNDDVMNGDPAFLSTTDLDWREERNQLTEDRSRRRLLLRHLNDNIEYYHRAIWLGMDPNRRYMLLDGFEAPNSDGRSVASVVENRLIGVVGNSLVMPVAPGFQLDPVLAEALEEEDDPEKVLDQLYEVEPSPPRRHSVPTKGIFAEAMAGTCKSCELIEEDRFWRWKDYPLPDSPPAIAALSTDSRFAAQGSLAPTAMPSPLVNFQAIPEAPDPTGMAAALDILGKDVFKDLTGLTQNQKNAMAAFTTAMGSSEAFAGEAFKLSLAQDAARSIDRTLGQIQSAKDAGYLDTNQASAATRDALMRAFGADNGTDGEDLTSIPEVEEAIKKAAEGGSATVTRGNGDSSETVSFTTEEGDLTIGAAKGHVREYPIDIWLDVPLIKDQITAALDYEDSARTDVIELARFMALQLGKIGAQDVFIDILESAIDAGFLRVNPADNSRFQIKVPATIGYPADPKDINKMVVPKKGNYPFVVLVHGNSTAWELKNPITDTGRVTSNLPIVKVTADDRKDYTGYEYLQTALAELKQPIVSISFSQAFANMVGSFVEMRSEMLLEALRQVIDEASKPGALLANVDFQKTGLFGHSRGGEAVVRAYHAQKVKAIPNLKLNAVCALSPTDFRGATNAHKLSMPSEPDSNFIVVYGTADGDVSGERLAGVIDKGGNGFRLYDRSSANRSMVTIPNATHNRFNRKWPDNVEWPLGLPAGALSVADHEALAIEYVGGFFDLILNGNTKLQSHFRNEAKRGAAKPTAIQWRFATSETIIDSYSGAAADTGTRNAGAGGSHLKFTSLTPPAAAADTSRELRVPHDDHAYVIEKAAVGGPAHELAYEFAPIDVSGFDALTFRLGQLYPIVDQAAIDAVAPPVFKIHLEDDAGKKGSIDSATIYANQQNGWIRPTKKISGSESTLMYLQTLQVKKKQLQAAEKKLDLAKLKKLKFEFTTDATAQDEIWLDTLLLVRN